MTTIGRAVLVFVLTAGTAACIDTSADGPTRMFRVDAGRSGAFPPQPSAASGKIAWTFSTSGAVRSSPVVAGRFVLVGSGNGVLYAIDRESGRASWRFRARSPISSSPAVRGDLVYVGDRENRVYAVDLPSGQRRWDVQTGPDIPWPWGHEGWDYFTSSPLVVGDMVIAGSGDGNVYAFDAYTGGERWKTATGGRVRASPSYADSTVYVGSTDGVFYAFDLATGAVRWTYETEGVGHNAAAFGFDRTSIQSTAAVDDERVYFGSRDGGVYALDRTSGALVWRADHGTSWIVGSPALAGPNVCVGGSDGQFLECLDRQTGERVWQIPTGTRVFSSPAAAGNLLLVGTHAGMLEAVDVADGTRRWSLPLGSEILSSPEIVDGMVYVGTDGGSMQAIRLSSDPPPERIVYWDDARRAWNMMPHHEAVRDYFAARGYTVANYAELVAFMEARVEDHARSVVVFAMDDFPHPAGVPSSDTLLGRRYLDAGGKIVWLGVPPLIITHNARGDAVAIDRDAPTEVLGVDFSSWNGDRYTVRPNQAGRRWGLSDSWIGGSAIGADQVTEVLASSEGGGAGAWVKSYGGPPGTGFVWLGQAADAMVRINLAEALAVAERGIGREGQEQ